MYLKVPKGKTNIQMFSCAIWVFFVSLKLVFHLLDLDLVNVRSLINGDGNFSMHCDRKVQ
uniref:Uncharacterized protein n=1 Tax=Anguilla anguilla TaxID=7936 RepID=A0A0E9SWZ2_ANGAN